MNTHGDHQCMMCDYRSRTEGRLKKHMRDSHTIEEQIAVGLDVDQASSTSGTSATATPITRNSTTPVESNASSLATSTASVLEAANIAAAAQAAAAVAAAAANANSNSSSSTAATVPSDPGSGQSAPSLADTTPPSDMASSSSSSAVGPSSSYHPSALEQIRAFTENPNVLPELSATNLATALFSQGLIGSSPTLQENLRSSLIGDEPSTSTTSGERSRGCSNKPKTYKCKQCAHLSMSKEEQWAHARTHIPVEKQLACTRCGFVTEYKHHLVSISALWYLNF